MKRVPIPRDEFHLTKKRNYKQMKNILIVFTGGTFSMMIDPKTGGAVPRFSGDELIAKIPEVKSLANITCFDFGQYPGPHMTPKLMMELSQTIKGEITKTDKRITRS